MTTSNKTGIQYAGFGRRLLANFIDLLIFFPISLQLQSVFGLKPFGYLSANSLQEVTALSERSNNLIMYMPSLFILIIIMVFWVQYDGATPGKKVLGIKIQKADGSPITYPVAFVRWLGYMISGMLLGLGYIWILFDKKKQGWHDKIAQTVVVKTDKKPNMFLAVFLALLGMLMILAYTGAIVFHMFSLVNDKVTSAQQPRLNSETVSTEAKMHYEASIDFITKAKSETTDEAIIPLADQAIDEAIQATEADPDNPVLWYHLGDAYTWPNSTGTLEDGYAAYLKAAELEPNNAVYLDAVGDQLIRMQRYDDAVIELKKALRINNESASINFSLGKAYVGLKLYDDAETHFEEAVRLFEEDNVDGEYDSKILSAKKYLSDIRNLKNR